MMRAPVACVGQRQRLTGCGWLGLTMRHRMLRLSLFVLRPGEPSGFSSCASREGQITAHAWKEVRESQLTLPDGPSERVASGFRPSIARHQIDLPLKGPQAAITYPPERLYRCPHDLSLMSSHIHQDPGCVRTVARSPT